MPGRSPRDFGLHVAATSRNERGRAGNVAISCCPDHFINSKRAVKTCGGFACPGMARCGTRQHSVKMIFRVWMTLCAEKRGIEDYLFEDVGICSLSDALIFLPSCFATLYIVR